MFNIVDTPLSYGRGLIVFRNFQDKGKYSACDLKCRYCVFTLWGKPSLYWSHGEDARINEYVKQHIVKGSLCRWNQILSSNTCTFKYTFWAFKWYLTYKNHMRYSDFMNKKTQWFFYSLCISLLNFNQILKALWQQSAPFWCTALHNHSVQLRSITGL